MEQAVRHEEAKKITLLGIVVNVVLTITKISFGIIGYSQALIADGIHSASDLLIDALVLVAAKYGSQRADSEHPYGHQRIETVATLALAVILILTGGFIIVDSIADLLKNNNLQPKQIVFWLAILSAIINEILFIFTKKIGNNIKSNLLIANAWHHRSDAASSLIVAIGIVGAMLGYSYCDTIAALIVGALIIKMGCTLGWHNVRELIDTGLDADTISMMKAIIFEIPGVKSIHQLRTRKMGSAIFVDLHIQVKPFLSVSEGHYIAHQVHTILMDKMPEVIDVTVHIDPENDEINPYPLNLPNQKIILALLQQRWESLPESKAIEKIILHYLEGKISIEVKMPLSILRNGNSAAHLLHQFQERIKDISEINQVELWFR